VFRLIAAALAAGLAGTFPAAAQTESATFRVDVQLVTVVATVKDAAGELVTGLEKQDFTVAAAGVPQEIALFERQTGRPLSVALLFDASLSVAKELRFQQQAALRFVRSLLSTGSHPDDRVAVYKFSGWVDELTDHTASLARLERALSTIRPDSGTSMYDALYLAAERLEKRDGRRVAIIITDGGDTTSTTTYAQALEAVQRAEVAVYSIIVVPITSDAGRNLGGENALRTISASTGGVTFRQHADDKSLDAAFRQIERDLRIQYVLGFYPRGVPPSRERFYPLDIKVSRPGVSVLARNGYYAEPGGAEVSSPEPAVSVPAAAPRERPKPAPPSPRTKTIPRSIP
jgi:Ca-activated chloride channel family protein